MVIPWARDHRTNGISPSSWYVTIAMCSLTSTTAKRSNMILTPAEFYRPRDEALAGDFIVKASATKKLSTNIVSPASQAWSDNLSLTGCPPYGVRVTRVE